MRRLFMVVVALALAAGAASASTNPEQAYVAVLGDGEHTVWCVNPPANTPFDVWIWWLPSVRGMMAATYNVALPANVIMTGVVANPNVQPALGCVGYYCAVFTSCQMGWVWTHRFTCMVLPEGVGVPAVIRVAPAPGAPSIEYANCEPGYPPEPVILHNYLNLYFWDAVEPATWGSIKNLYR
jgi:hypothetical protein